MHSILLQIIEKKQKDLYEQKKVLSINVLKRKASAKKSENKFKNKLLHPTYSNMAIIAEIKLASPTIPSLGTASDIMQRAIAYEEAKVDAMSFITEKHIFKGNTTFISQLKTKVKLHGLTSVASSNSVFRCGAKPCTDQSDWSGTWVNLPVLQKDFVIDPYQVYEAKMIGSDAILLIARLVDRDVLKSFVALSQEIGIEPVVEINDEEDLEKALNTTTSFIAVNARDLRTLTIDIPKACSLMEKIPDKFIKLGFSGIHSSSEVERYKEAEAKGVLVGTSLMKAANIYDFINSLRSI